MKILIVSATIAFIIYNMLILVFKRKQKTYNEHLEKIEMHEKTNIITLEKSFTKLKNEYTENYKTLNKSIEVQREELEHLKNESETVELYIEQRKEKLEQMKEDFISPLDMPKYIELFLKYDRNVFQKERTEIYANIMKWVFAKKLIPNKLDPFTQSILQDLPETILDYRSSLEKLSDTIEYYDVLALRSCTQEYGEKVLGYFVNQFELDPDFKKVINAYLVKDFEKTFQSIKDLIYLVETFTPERIINVYVANKEELTYLKPLITPHIKPRDRITYTVDEALLGGMVLEDQYFSINATHLEHLNEIIELKDLYDK